MLYNRRGKILFSFLFNIFKGRNNAFGTLFLLKIARKTKIRKGETMIEELLKDTNKELKIKYQNKSIDYGLIIDRNKQVHYFLESKMM